jgi:hypothetical protein
MFLTKTLRAVVILIADAAQEIAAYSKIMSASKAAAVDDSSVDKNFNTKVGPDHVKLEVSNDGNRNDFETNATYPPPVTLPDANDAARVF